MTRSNFAILLGAAALCGICLGVPAQTIYRIVGADGKVTFSDKPPASVDQGKVIGTGVGASGVSTGAALPFELKQVVAKYPVTLYTAAKCAPCDAGRSLLSGRGVPFSERTVTSPEDSEYLQRLTGESSLPFLTIGGQRLKGFAESEWVTYLDAAGYPKTSVLPSGYQNQSPSPLVSVQKVPAAKAQERPESPAAESPVNLPDPNTPNPANPAGIKF